MKQKISVTAEDIKNGTPECEASCPVALALARQFPDAVVCVDKFDISIDDQVVRTPADVSYFVTDFDSAAPVEPFEFEIDITP